MGKRAGISHFFTKVMGASEGEHQDYVSKLWPGDFLDLECKPGEAGGRAVVNVLGPEGRVLGHLRPDRSEAAAEDMAKGYSYHAYVTEVARGAPGEPPEVSIMVVVAEPNVEADEAKRYVLEDRRLRRELALDAPYSAKRGAGWTDTRLRTLGMAVLIIVVAIVLMAWLYS